MNSIVVASAQAPSAGPVPYPDLRFDDAPAPGEVLMARDAARLERLEHDPALGPSITWFTWDRPTITLGRLQEASAALDEPACAAAGIPVVRRPTGGRAVFHADEWTHGAVIPLDHRALGGSLARSCRALVEVVLEALAEAYGIVPDPETRAARGGAAPGAACFARAFGYEAKVDGRKLLGSAQRRSSRALLQQGSLLVGPGHERLARYLAGGGGAAPEWELAERELAASAVTLSELLGRRPDPAPFREAFARAWRVRTAAGARSR